MLCFLHLILQGCVDGKDVSSKTNLVFANRLLYWLLVVLFDLGFASVNTNGCMGLTEEEVGQWKSELIIVTSL